MKKIISLLTVVAMLFVLSSCGETMIICNICGAENAQDSQYCSGCGAKKVLATYEYVQEDTTIKVEHSTEKLTQKTNAPKTEKTTVPKLEIVTPQVVEKHTVVVTEKIIPSINASSTSVYLNDSFQEIFITVDGLDKWRTTYNIANKDIVSCEWGEWDGGTCPLIFIPLKSGNTYVTVFLEGYNKKIIIDVSVRKTAVDNIKKAETSHAHSYSKTIFNPTCLEQGWTTYKCFCGYEYNDNYVPAKGHVVVIDRAVPATATTTGLTEGKHCSVCKSILLAQQIVPKDFSSLINNTTFSLTNSLSEEYSYVSSVLYSKCKIENIEYDVSPYGTNGEIQLNIKFQFKKTYQGDTKMNNIKFHYTLYNEDGIAVKSGDIIETHADFDVLYEKTIFYTGQPGNYTMTCKSVRY